MFEAIICSSTLQRIAHVTIFAGIFGRYGFALLTYVELDIIYKVQFIYLNTAVRLCIKPVTEPDQTEPTEITENTRPNLRELPYVPGRTYG